MQNDKMRLQLKFHNTLTTYTWDDGTVQFGEEKTIPDWMDLFTGKFTIYNHLGFKVREWHMTSGFSIDGIHQEWYDNKQLKVLMYFKDSKPHGIRKRWNHHGKLISEYEYNGDNILLWDWSQVLKEDEELNE